MEKIIKREYITEDIYREILDVETHHDHEIIQDKSGALRWKADEDVRRFRPKIDLNDLWQLFNYLGYGRNCEFLRQLYRDMGYSLFGYWEVFYWEANNPEADQYKPNKEALGKKDNR